jgi:hypothetical protein
MREEWPLGIAQGLLLIGGSLCGAAIYLNLMSYGETTLQPEPKQIEEQSLRSLDALIIEPRKERAVRTEAPLRDALAPYRVPVPAPADVRASSPTEDALAAQTERRFSDMAAKLRLRAARQR